MYGDLAQLLVPGFLTATVRVAGHSFSLRSLGPGDLARVSSIVPQSDPEWRLWVVAMSVWQADGILLLEDLARSPRAVFESLRRAPAGLAGQMFGVCVGFFRRMQEANRYLESYLYEEESRRLWEGTRRGHHPLWSRSPLPGLNLLGVNQFQASWIAWNQLEDERLEKEHAWSLAKVMVSLQSHKSYRQLESRDKSRLELQEESRRGVRELAWDRYRGLASESDSRRDSSNRLRSPEELAEEMDRWVRGELDFHDQIVADYKQKVREQFDALEAQTSELQRLAAERRQREQEELGAGVRRPAMVALTAAELDQKLGRGYQPSRVLEEDAVNHTFNRYLRSEPEKGFLTLDSQGKVALADSVPAAAASLSLDQLVASRAPRFEHDE